MSEPFIVDNPRIRNSSESNAVKHIDEFKEKTEAEEVKSENQERKKENQKNGDPQTYAIFSGLILVVSSLLFVQIP